MDMFVGFHDGFCQNGETHVQVHGIQECTYGPQFPLLDNEEGASVSHRKEQIVTFALYLRPTMPSRHHHLYFHFVPSMLMDFYQHHQELERLRTFT